MLVFGLVQDRGWEPFEDPAEQRPARSWRLPWRPLAWVAAWCWLMALVPVVGHAYGAPAGYGVLMLAVALVFWRVERWCSRQYWHGLREHSS